MPMLRLGGVRIYGHDQRWTFITQNMFAGSIFNLEEGTEYECNFKLRDADNSGLSFEETRIIKTRKEPQPHIGGKTYHVYPLGYT